MQYKIKSLSQLKEIVSRLKLEGRQIVFTNGCFDLLHVGHTRYLALAKAQGDVLIVALNSDASVHSIKGPLRPILPQDERAELLAALEMVDYVVIFDESDPYNVIKELQPNVLVKGGDWSLDKIIGRDVVEAAGGRVERIQVVDGASTTNIIKKIVSLYGGKNE